MCRVVNFILGLISLKTLRLEEHELSQEDFNALRRLEEHPALETLHLDAQCQINEENCASLLKIPQLVTLSCKFGLFWHPKVSCNS